MNQLFTTRTWVTVPNAGLELNLKGCRVRVLEVRQNEKDPDRNQIKIEVLSRFESSLYSDGRIFIVGEKANVYQFELLEGVRAEHPAMIEERVEGRIERVLFNRTSPTVQ